MEERGHISILLTAFLFSLTHTLSLSQTHPLLRGGQEREGAVGEEREENNAGGGGGGRLRGERGRDWEAMGRCAVFRIL